jgi:sterol desaturase/sphingolipid hydroxylase (fatty acid hydroxylase superfamily)
METTREALLLLISTPIYAFVIGLEMLLSHLHHKDYYSLKGTLTNIYLTCLNFGLDVLLLTFCIALLSFFYQFHSFTITSPFLYWSVLLIFEDFVYYLLHYVDHYCRFFWAIHVTHHSSTEFNLTVGFRSSVFQPLYRFIYFIPLALLGFKPIDILFMYSATQIYGILIHTQAIGKLGFLEYFLSTPSHHRVHHASNPEYLDKNMGMIFIIWDKLFGTFVKEKPGMQISYGLTKNVEKPNAVKIVTHEWSEIIRDLKRPLPIKVKLMYLFGPPGWSHDGSRKTSKQMRAEKFNDLAAN